MKSDESFILLQEILWPDRWKSTVACVLLNRTKRTQVDKVWPKLFEKAPDASSLLKMSDEDLIIILKPLGLSKVRSKRLKNLAEDWLNKVEFERMRGVGEYAVSSDKIFYRNEIPEEVKDHALKYYIMYKKNGRRK